MHPASWAGSPLTRPLLALPSVPLLAGRRHLRAEQEAAQGRERLPSLRRVRQAVARRGGREVAALLLGRSRLRVLAQRRAALADPAGIARADHLLPASASAVSASAASAPASSSGTICVVGVGVGAGVGTTGGAEGTGGTSSSSFLGTRWPTRATCKGEHQRPQNREEPCRFHLTSSIRFAFAWELLFDEERPDRNQLPRAHAVMRPAGCTPSAIRAVEVWASRARSQDRERRRRARFRCSPTSVAGACVTANAASSANARHAANAANTGARAGRNRSHRPELAVDERGPERAAGPSARACACPNLERTCRPAGAGARLQRSTDTAEAGATMKYTQHEEWRNEPRAAVTSPGEDTSVSFSVDALAGRALSWTRPRWIRRRSRRMLPSRPRPRRAPRARRATRPRG